MGVNCFGVIKKFINLKMKLCPSYFNKLKKYEEFIEEQLFLEEASGYSSTNILSSPEVSHSLVIEKPWKWDSLQVTQWLISIGYGIYSKLFSDNEINCDTFTSLNDQDLKDLGINSSFDRKIITKKLKKLVSAHKPPPLKAKSLLLVN